MRYFKLFAVLLLIVLIVTPFGISASAASRSYYVSDYNADINITPDGSANVEERITYDFSGSFNGVYVNFDSSGSQGIEDMNISVLRGGNESKISESSYTISNGTYVYTYESGLDKYTIYESSSNEKKTLIFRYKLLNVITSYNDYAEFDRLVIPKHWECSLHNVNINIFLPDGAKKEDLRVYAHGPLTGTSKIVDGKTVNFTVPSVPAYTFVETIVLFPPSLVPDCKYKSSEDRLPLVLEREAKLANEANAQRAIAIFQYIAAGFLFIIWIVIMLYLYMKYDRELKPEFTGRYYRELPGNYSPAEVTMLMNSLSLGSKDIMATILDLVRRKHLTIEKIAFERQGFFGKKTEEDYKISLINNAENDKLASHEKHLIDWFINDIGDGKSVALEDIKGYTKDRANALEFNSSFGLWKDFVRENADKLKFNDASIFHGKMLGVVIGIVFALIGFIYIGLLSNPEGGIPIIILGAVMVIYSSLFKRRTKYGNEQHKLWQGFKNFIEDFSQIKSAGITSIVIWEHYLVYAVSLGVADNIIRYMPEIAGVQGVDNTGVMPGMLYWQLGGLAYFNNAFSSCITAVNSSISAAQIASSANSSGGGFGGGFSGGGGFGGGGGGGGGAF